MGAAERPSWDTYFMQIADVAATRSTCVRRHVGAVLVSPDRHILSTGYNGVPRGVEHCATRGCIRTELAVPSGTKHELCRGLHGEQNALIQAARHSALEEGATLYCTTYPCVQCAKMLINAGVRRIVFKESYPDELSASLLKEAGVIVQKYEEGVSE